MITRNLEGKFKNGTCAVVLHLGVRFILMVDAEACAGGEVGGGPCHMPPFGLLVGDPHPL